MPLTAAMIGLLRWGSSWQTAEAAGAVVAVGTGVAGGGGLQVPAGAEDLFPRPGQDGDAQVGVVAEGAEGLAHDPAGGEVDGVGLGAVEGDFEDVARGRGADRVRSSGPPWLYRKTTQQLIDFA